MDTVILTECCFVGQINLNKGHFYFYLTNVSGGHTGITTKYKSAVNTYRHNTEVLICIDCRDLEVKIYHG